MQSNDASIWIILRADLPFIMAMWENQPVARDRSFPSKVEQESRPLSAGTRPLAPFRRNQDTATEHTRYLERHLRKCTLRYERVNREFYQ